MLAARARSRRRIGARLFETRFPLGIIGNRFVRDFRPLRFT